MKLIKLVASHFNFFKMNFVIIMLSVLISSCFQIQISTVDLKSMINDAPATSVQKLNTNGAFHNNDENGYYVNRPIYFFKNGLAYFGNSSLETIDDVKLENEWNHRNLKNQKDWGIYKIKADTINVSAYIKFQDSRAYYLLTHFQGIIKSPDTITNWHVVSPYPELSKSVKQDYSMLLTGRRTLYLKPVSYKPYMDSISEQIWIKYRNKN